MDLGRESKSPEGLTAPAQPEKPKISYPSFNLNDETAKAFCKENKCALGDEFTATVVLRVCSQRADEYGTSIGFDVKSLDGISREGDEDDGEEGKTLGYERPKSVKETPDMSAKSLESV